MEEQDIKEEVITEEIVTEEQPKPPEEAVEEKKETRKEKKEKKKLDKEKEELRLANLELKEKVLRITAEMQNMRRRYDADLANSYKYDGFDLVEKILPVIDNFERAMNTKVEGAEKFLDGFKMIYGNLINILKSKGITEIDALGKPFNPSIMNAVMTEANNDVEEGIVLDILQKGYMYNDKLLRPAMVKVSEKEN
ncbi:MAG: nucleotide exchange factor GrpE [Bacilli bacterium]|nr:nucleotide exchange factor GrpE [Bacilli bacterium]